MNHVVDIIIIGGGIAGLYAAYQIKRLTPPKTSFLILEKNPNFRKEPETVAGWSRRE